MHRAQRCRRIKKREIDFRFRGNDREEHGNDPGETGFHGVGIKDSKNDRIRR